VSHVLRLQTTDRIFFVTVNLHRALVPLAEMEFRLVTEALAASPRKLGFLLCGDVVMPDHWHALIWTDFPLTISRAVQDVKWSSASSLNRARGAGGTVWQHQFWDRFVRNPREFGQRLDYRQLNPVRKGLASGPENWRWSSYNNFALDKDAAAGCPIQIDPVHLPESYRG
jgi:REP element-mobilizing transposase RayT